MVLIPCYIQPEKMMQLALAVLDNLEGLSDDVIVEPNSVILGRDGQFSTSVLKKKSIRGRVLRGGLCFTAPLIRHINGVDKTREWARRQLLLSLAAYAYAWSESDSRQRVPLEERFVFDPEVILSLGINGRDAVASSVMFRKFLQDLEVIKASQVHCKPPPAMRQWMNAWDVQYGKNRVYTGQQMG